MEDTSGPAKQPAAFARNLREGATQISPEQYKVRDGANPAEMVLLSLDSGFHPAQVLLTPGNEGELVQVIYQQNTDATFGTYEIRPASELLTRDCVGAGVDWDKEKDTLNICRAGKCVSVALPQTKR